MSSVLLSGAGVHAAPLQRHTAPMHTVAASPSAATRVADAARYQAVQKRTPEAAKFEGGNTLVIFGSTTAVVLFIILLVLLV